MVVVLSHNVAEKVFLGVQILLHTFSAEFSSFKQCFMFYRILTCTSKKYPQGLAGVSLCTQIGLACALLVIINWKMGIWALICICWCIGNALWGVLWKILSKLNIFLFVFKLIANTVDLICSEIGCGHLVDRNERRLRDAGRVKHSQKNVDNRFTLFFVLGFDSPDSDWWNW